MQDTVEVDGGKRKRGRPPLKVVETPEAPTAEVPEVPTVEIPNRKIAVMGSAASSVGLTPFDDPSWEIWSCSPANKGIPRCDVWFELHNPELKVREGLTEWLEWLKTKPIVYMQKPYPGYLGAREYPLKAIIEKWGPFWWTSQLAFMIALAIEQQPQTIGIYGVDMAANSEYNQQRLACQYFIQHIIKETNIELIVPPESDILEPAPLYGYCESSRNWRKLHARNLELKQRVAQLKSEVAQKDAEAAHLVGALDDMEYQLAHWANRMDFR